MHVGMKVVPTVKWDIWVLLGGDRSWGGWTESGDRNVGIIMLPIFDEVNNAMLANIGLNGYARGKKVV